MLDLHIAPAVGELLGSEGLTLVRSQSPAGNDCMVCRIALDGAEPVSVLALDNTRQISIAYAHPKCAPSCVVPVGDDFATKTLLFITDKNSMMAVDEPTDPDELLAMLAGAERAFTGTVRPICPIPFTVDDAGNTALYTVPDNHPAASALANARTLLAGTAYANQTQTLNADEPDDIYVAGLQGFTTPDGAALTMTGIGDILQFNEFLLPQADMLGIVADAGLWMIPFDKAMQILRLVPEHGYRPTRYRLRGFPTGKTMRG